MVDILHKVGIKSSSLDDVYKALTAREGLSGWWTVDTRGDSKVGGVLQFRFGAGGFGLAATARARSATTSPSAPSATLAKVSARPGASSAAGDFKGDFIRRGPRRDAP